MKLGLGIGLKFGRRAGAAAGAPPTDFRILVNTGNAGVSGSNQFQFTGALGDYDVEVYDQTGTTLLETITGLSNAATITIAAGAGTYELRVFASEVSGFNRIRFNNGGDKDKLLEVRNWGDIVWSSMANAFDRCSNLTSITSNVPPDLTNVESFFSFVYNCTSLVTLDVSNWNTSNVTNFGFFAYACFDLVALDVSNWNTQNVTNFGFFAYACFDLVALDVSNWNTQNVTNFGEFARFCSSLTDIIGIENIDISSVTNFTNFLLGTTLPTSRYDALLINYESQAPNPNLNFHGGNSKYTAGGAAEAARTSLATTYNWTISDEGPV